MGTEFDETDIHSHICENCDSEYSCSGPDCDLHKKLCPECLDEIGEEGNESTEELNQ
jgi:hypothetical protein